MVQKLFRNVAGVQGLDLALEAIPEDLERRLFHSPVWFLPDREQALTKDRRCEATGPRDWDADAWTCLKLVRDAFPEHDVPPDYCLGNDYPKGAGFQHHFDSRFRWGETVIGVTVGQQGIVYFMPSSDAVKRLGPPSSTEDLTKHGVSVVCKEYESGGFAVEVELPRRSVFVNQGSVRYDWKHGIRKQIDKRLKDFPHPPSWNSYNMRRSLTWRATKAYSDAFLRHLLARNPTDQSIKRRIKAADKFPPQTGYGQGKLNAQDLAEERASAERTLQQMLRCPLFGGAMPVGGYGAPAAALGGGGFASQGHALGMDPAAQILAALGGGFASSQGRTLGGGSNRGNEDEAEQLQAAIRLSLQPQDQNSRRPDHDGAAASDPIVLLDDSDDDNGGGKKPAAAAKGPSPNTAATEPISLLDDDDDSDSDNDEGGGNDVKPAAADGDKRAASPAIDDRDRMRMVRLRRFDHED